MRICIQPVGDVDIEILYFLRIKLQEVKFLMIIKLQELVSGSVSLSSRELGAFVRSKILEALNISDTSILDFDSIELITQSFGDEVLGVLIREFGFPVVKEKVKIVNANPLIKQVLKLVISYSKRETVSVSA